MSAVIARLPGVTGWSLGIVIVHTNAVPANAVAFESLEPVAWRHA